MTAANSNPGEILVDKTEIESPIDWIGLLYAIWESRKLIATVTGIVTVLAIVVSLLLPNYYRSACILLPETDQNKLGGLIGLTGLASLAGINFGEVPLEVLYPDIILSEAVLKEAIYHSYHSTEWGKKVNLIQYWNIDKGDSLWDYEMALETIRKELVISVERKTNIVGVAILTKEPQLSADIIRNIVSSLDRFLRTKKVTNATEQRLWIESRLEEVKVDLKEAEDGVREFREKNRRIIDSPKLLLEQERLIREVEINSTLFVELKKQYEIAKIEEIKNIPIINVMDPARPAGRKSSPKRTYIVIVLFLVSGFSACLFVLFRRKYSPRWQLLRNLFIHKGSPQDIDPVSRSSNDDLVQ